MYGVDLHAVDAASLAEGGGAAKTGDDAVDLFDRNLPVEDRRVPAVRDLRGRNGTSSGGGDAGGAAVAGGKLDEYPASVGMGALCQPVELLLRVPEVGALRTHKRVRQNLLHRVVHEAGTGDDETETAAGAGDKVFHAVVRQNASGIHKSKACHGSHDIAVLQRQGADPGGGEKQIRNIVHRVLLKKMIRPY